jgi:hypothetical protein
VADEDQKGVKKSRILGKWDWIVCAILSFLSTAGRPHSLGLSQAPAEWIAQWIGAFAAILLIWIIVKSLTLWIRRLLSM